MKLNLQLKLIIMQYLENNKGNEVMTLKDLIYAIEENLHEIGMSKEEKASLLKTVLAELEEKEFIHCFKNSVYKGIYFDSGVCGISVDNFEDLEGTFINEVKFNNFQYTEDNTEFENILTDANIEQMVNAVIELGLAYIYVQYSDSEEEGPESNMKDDFSRKLIMLFEDAEYEAEGYEEVVEEYYEDDELYYEDDEIEHDKYKVNV